MRRTMPDVRPTLADPLVRRMPWWQPAALLAGVIALLLCGAAFGWFLLQGRLAGRVAVAHLADAALLRELAALEQQVAEWLVSDIGRMQEVLAADQCNAAPPLDITAFRPAVADRAAQATVQVIVRKPSATVLGTGFFVTPDRLVSSSRLLADALEVLVSNSRIDARPARIVARSGGQGIGQADFALLSVEGVQGIPLPLRSQAAIGDPISVPRFAPFQSKPLDATLSAGNVGAARALSTGVPVIGHTVAVAAANVGGPVIDRCGSVIAVHAVGYLDVAARYAIAAPALASFLASHGVSFATADGPCLPEEAGK
jgi:S1-C subfamily serine protease